MESKRRKQIAKAAVLAATIAGGAFMFASPYEAKASSGGEGKSRICYYASPMVIYCTAVGIECKTAVGCL